MEQAMKRVFWGLPAIASILLWSAPSNAAFIFEISPGAGTPANGDITNVSLSDFDASTVDDDDTAATLNFATFDVEVKAQALFDADVNVSGFPFAGDPPSPPAPFTEYAFTISLTNSLADVLETLDVFITNVDLDDTDDHALLGVPDFDEEDTPALAATRINGQHIRFTGLGLASGGSTTLSFWLDLPDAVYPEGTTFPGFSLSFLGGPDSTPDVPEPASIALAGLVCGLGGLVARRRRKTQAKENAA